MSGSRLTIHSFRAGMPPIICAPSVRPWKAPSKLTIPILRSPPAERPWVRASLTAASVVSDPVVSRKTFSSGSGASSASRLTRRERISLGKQ